MNKVLKHDFGALFDASPNPYLVLDRRLHIAGANKAYLNSVKRDLDDIVGRWAWDAFPADEETVRQAVASFERVIRTKRADTMSLLRFDVPAPEAEGGGLMERYWSISHVPVFASNGEVEFVLQHPIDVTELQHLRDAQGPQGNSDVADVRPAHSGIFSRARDAYESTIALKDESDRLNAMFAQAPSFMALLRGPEHKFELANPSFMGLTGNSGLVGRTVAESMPEAVAQGYLKILDRVFQTGEPFVARGARYTVQTAPDEAVREHYLDFVYQPLKDAAGRVTGIFVEGTDVTDVAVGDAALRASEARNRQILDSAIDYAIIATDIDGRVTRWNEGAFRILGWTEKEMLGHNAERFFTPEDVAAGQPRAEMREAAEKGRGKDERWHQRKGGERFWASGEMTVLRDENGNAVGYVKVLRDHTEQHRADQARKTALHDLQIERAHLRAILDSAPVAILVVEASSGRMLEQNARAEAFFGNGTIWAETADNRSNRTLFLPDGRPLEVGRHPLMRAITQGEISTGEEYLYLRDDGQARWIQLTASPIFDSAGRLTSGILLAEDIESRKQTEAALRASQQRLTALVSASSEVLYSMSADWAEMRQLAGSGFLADTRTANRNWFTDYIPRDEQPRVRAAIDEAVRTKRVFSLEHQVKRVDGSMGWTLSRAVPLLDANGTIEEWFGAASDVTARREASAAMGRLNERLEHQVAEQMAERNQMWNSSPDLLLVTDLEGRVRRVNPAWTTLLGYEPEEVVGRRPTDFVIADDQAESVAAFQAAATGGPPKVENRYRHKDGSTRWISWVAVPVGNVFYATGRDITSEKAATEELSLTQEALRQSQKMEAVGQLTGGLAHDFNNLLVGVSGSLELLQIRIAQGRFNDVERYVTTAQEAVKRAAALTHRLLAFSRRQTLAPKSTNVEELVEGLEDMVKRTAGPAIRVATIKSDGSWRTLVDPGQLENALLNLCINARDAMPDGGALTIKTADRSFDEHAARTHRLTPGDYLSLSVSDTGTGMSPDVIAKAFDPFFTTKPLGMGTGLGLSMVYGFVQQSGGQVLIESEVGKGTSVCLYLPRHVGEDERGDISTELTDAPRAEENETVLVVDDEPVVRMSVTEVLNDLGYNAIEAEDGKSGLQVLQSDARIDLLVSDVGLPGGMNGRQMADAARVVRPDLKVLFITGYAENVVFNGGQAERNMHVLTKPFTMDTLARQIKELIVGI